MVLEFFSALVTGLLLNGYEVPNFIINSNQRMRAISFENAKRGTKELAVVPSFKN